MSMKDKFKVDIAAVTDGVWVDCPVNADGTVPSFKLAYANKQNKKYTAAMRKWAKPFEDENGVPDFTSLKDDEADKYTLDLFVDTILLDWRNIQPEDDGVVLPFNRENAINLLGAPEWAALFEHLNSKSKRIANFQKKVLTAHAKNS